MADGLREWGAAVGGNPNPSSSSSSSSSSYSSCYSESGECVFDGTELDAARVLACFTPTALRESGGRMRKRKRLESRFPASDREDLDNRVIKVTNVEDINLEEKPPASSNCSSNVLTTSSVRKMRQNLSQAEREARRMHRVLANRESARQTIRRRQALRDDLTRKVSELSLDNQNMRMEKERIMKEHMSLKRRNNQLKDEMAMAIACNIMGLETSSASLETSSSQHKHPFLANTKLPFVPGAWPSWPIIATTHSGLFDTESDSHKAPGPQTLLYMPSFSWFYSLLHRMSASSQLMAGIWSDKETEISVVCSKSEVVQQKSCMEEQSQRENSTIHEPVPLKGKAAKMKSCKLDMDFNFKSETSEPIIDYLNHKPADSRMYVVEGSTEQSETFMDPNAAAAARRRRKEIIKLKHLCGGPIGARN